MDHLAVVALFTPRLDAGAEVARILNDMIEPTRGEPGCLQYDLYEHDGGFLLFERYRDEKAIAAHQATEHYRGYRSAIAELLAEPVGVIVGSPMDVL